MILATERRATMGNLVASKRAKKVYQIADRIGMTTAGGVGRRPAARPDHDRGVQPLPDPAGKAISVGAISTLLSNYLNQNRYFPVLRPAPGGRRGRARARPSTRWTPWAGPPGGGDRRHRLRIADGLRGARGSVQDGDVRSRRPSTSRSAPSGPPCGATSGRARRSTSS